jgi:hypothetical protein
MAHGCSYRSTDGIPHSLANTDVKSHVGANESSFGVADEVTF